MVKTIGIIGGGQLGRMMIPAIKQLGMRAAVLDPAPDCPCASMCDRLIVAGFNDEAGFFELAKISDVITYEFEHINTALLKKLQQAGHKIFPSVDSLSIIQDKFTQKQALRGAGIAVPDFEAVKGVDQLALRFTKTQRAFMLKSRRGGYDGYGNHVVRSIKDIAAAFQKFDKISDNMELMAEPIVQFEKEVSVIATRGQDGKTVVYPIAENVHKNSILDVTTVPASISEKTRLLVIETAKKVMECFDGVGTFCTELFVNETTGEVLVNEVAPRVHNSGHYTINACCVSQFENHIRAIAGLPAGKTDMHCEAAAMKNVLGEPGHDGAAEFTGVEEALALNGVSVHIYGKANTKPGRKMGHVNLIGTPQEIKANLAKINVKAVAEKT